MHPRHVRDPKHLPVDLQIAQTVLSDLPLFTFLGLKEKDLPKRGLRKFEINGQVFWIPNVVAAHPGLDK